MPVRKIEEMKDRIVTELLPQRVYLFGSYADGTYTDESDFDFYIVVSDNTENLADVTARAYSAIGYEREYPVDILVGRASRFERLKQLPTVENEVYMKGVLLYGGTD